MLCHTKLNRIIPCDIITDNNYYCCSFVYLFCTLCAPVLYRSISTQNEITSNEHFNSDISLAELKTYVSNPKLIDIR